MRLMSNSIPWGWVLVKTARVVQLSKRAVVAYILWLFRGTFGGHRFYLERIGMAFTMFGFFLICWAITGIGMGLFLLDAVVLVWLIDAFLFLLMASYAIIRSKRRDRQ